MKAARGATQELGEGGKQESAGGGVIDDMLVASRVTDSCVKWKKE